MGTSGYISFIAGSQAKNAYSHYDSGPDDLGLTMLHWIRAASASPESLRTAISGLKVVSDDDGDQRAEGGQRRRRRARGGRSRPAPAVQRPERGRSGHGALLRRTQGTRARSWHAATSSTKTSRSDGTMRSTPMTRASPSITATKAK